MSRRDRYSAPARGGANSAKAASDAAQNDPDVPDSLDEMTSPADFDLLLSDRERSLRALEAAPETELGRLRRLQVLFAHDAGYPTEQIEEELAALEGVPTRSLVLMIRVDEKFYEAVIASDTDPRDASPLELEDASKAAAMVAVAALNLGRPYFALEHFRLAIALARALGTNMRLHAMLTDWHRARIEVGDPDPDGLELLMAQVMPPQYRQRTQRVRALALGEVGAYELALAALGPKQQDGPVDAAHREFIHAMLDLPAARDASDPLLDRSQPYFILAQAYRNARSRKPKRIDFSTITGVPYTGYARLIEARTLLGVKGMVRSALAVLGSTPPATPAQAVGWAAIRTVAAFESGQGVTALQSIEVLRTNLARVRGSQVITRAVRRTSPDLLLLLLLGPFGDRLSGLSDLPLLVGQTVMAEGNRIRLPGRTGRASVLEGAHHPDAPTNVSRSEQQRLDEALVGFGGRAQVVNVGTTLRYALAAYRAAQGTGDIQAVAAWASAYEHIYALLSEDVQSLFAAHPQDSLL